MGDDPFALTRHLWLVFNHHRLVSLVERLAYDTDADLEALRAEARTLFTEVERELAETAMELRRLADAPPSRPAHGTGEI